MLNEYRPCARCGHQVLADGQGQRYIVNSILDVRLATRPGHLVRMQSTVVERIRADGRFLLDIGSGSGKFLYCNRERFDRVLGIEVSKPCIDFSRRQLGLDIRDSLPEGVSPPSVVTMWHSLEHIPINSLLELLNSISKVADAKTRILISVPNNGSWQYQWFGCRYAYFDAPNHPHQFSDASLDLLMQNFGFKKDSQFFLFPYIVFGYVQGLLNCVMPTHNYFYYRFKRGTLFEYTCVQRYLLDLYALLGLAVAIPLGVVLSLLDWMCPAKQGVITRCFRRTA